MRAYPRPIAEMIDHFKRLPGVGQKSAERFTFHLLDWKSSHLQHFGANIIDFYEAVGTCSTCGCLTERGQDCPFCHDKGRNRSLLCVVASAKDLYTIAMAQSYDGLFHVLDGLLSPLEGRMADQLNLASLHSRLCLGEVREVIFAIDSTLEGDATCLFLREELSEYPVQISRLGFGLPMGSSLEYVDSLTLSEAFTGRKRVECDQERRSAEVKGSI